MERILFVTVTPAKYKKEYPYLKEVDSLALANKQMDLQSAFANRFSKSRKKNTGFPKFKSAKHSKKSYTTNNQNGTVAIVGNAIKLPKIGKVKARIHRQPPADWIIKSATKGFGNGKATLDNGYGLFLNMLGYKLTDRGKYFVKVDKWFASSQVCHCCGARHTEMKDLSIRTMKCNCGLTVSRDKNAAINIKMEGLRILKSA